MKKKNKISFDFDGSLGHKPHLQKLARELCMDPLNEVHIITRRYGQVNEQHGDEFSDVYRLANAVGIRPDRIHFTNRAYKLEKIKELEIEIHWDDDAKEVAIIRQYCPDCKVFLTI
jgi:hypothetical protein